MDRPLTVSEVAWSAETRGCCPDCCRDDLPLGRLNCGPHRQPACIDCHFGPPTEFWDSCPACGYWQPPGEKCDKCGEIIR
jgi:hypothetical protein